MDAGPSHWEATRPPQVVQRPERNRDNGEQSSSIPKIMLITVIVPRRLLQIVPPILLLQIALVMQARYSLFPFNPRDAKPEIQIEEPALAAASCQTKRRLYARK